MDLLKDIPQVLLDISLEIQKQGGQAYLVGGLVRDRLMGIWTSKDYDIEVHRIEADKLEELLKKYGKVSKVGKAFGILLMKIKGMQVDFSLPRSEVKTGSGHKGFEICTDPYLGFEKAAFRRDFTLNAIGLSVPQGEIEDPYSGVVDLKNKTLKHVSSAFGEDPLRALRAVQMIARFGLVVAPETVNICAEQDLSELAVERFDEEFKKLWLRSERPSLGLVWISKMELQRFFPELVCESEVVQQSLYVLVDKIAGLSKGLPDKERIVWAWSSLGAVIGADSLKSLLKRFTKDKKMIDSVMLRCGALNEIMSLQIETLADGEVRRLGIAYPINERLILAGAAYESMNGNWLEFKLGQAIVKKAKELGCFDKCPIAWVQGRDLMKLGMKPCKEMGVILKDIFEKQLDGDFLNVGEACAWIRVKYSDYL
jgi:tRNA nucleotidyltransferase (CCA-adding enzyme)